MKALRKGGTSTRGHKGAKSRSGYSRKIGFEGGQMPLQSEEFLNLDLQIQIEKSLEELIYMLYKTLVDNKKVKDSVNLEDLIANGLAHKNDLVKILGRGELKAKLNITVHGFSASAKICYRICWWYSKHIVI